MPFLHLVLDAIVPDTCVACRGVGGPLCADCGVELHREPPRRRDPSPRPAGLPPVTSAAVYAGVARTALLAYKERGRVRLARPLARALAAASLTSWCADGGGAATGGIVLVPVPSSARARRDRGHCHVETMAAMAAAALRAEGVDARHLCLLRRRGAATDSAGLSAAERADNGGGFVVRRRHRRAAVGARVVVVDDIVTTGATALAVTAALRQAGASVLGVAAVAATARRHRVPVTGAVGAVREDAAQ